MLNSKEQHLKLTSYLRIVLVAAVCLMFAGTLTALIFYPIPEENRSAVDILIGSINMILSIVFGYYFGNSAGSTRKRVLEHEVSTEVEPVVEYTPTIPTTQPKEHKYEDEGEHYDRY